VEQGNKMGKRDINDLGEEELLRGLEGTTPGAEDALLRGDEPTEAPSSIDTRLAKLKRKLAPKAG
jgi:hypothetical protein